MDRFKCYMLLMLLTLVYVVFVINVPNHVDMVYIWCIYYVLFNFLYIIFDSFWIILCEIIYTYSKYLHPCLTNLGGALIYCSFLSDFTEDVIICVVGYLPILLSKVLFLYLNKRE